MAAPVKDSLVMNENDLKSTLMNQKLRAEQHRSNYETIKAQHILLQKVKTSVMITLELWCGKDLLYRITWPCSQNTSLYQDSTIWWRINLKKSLVSYSKREMTRLQSVNKWRHRYPPCRYHGNNIIKMYKVLTGQKLDVIKLRVAEEIEAPYRKVNKLWCELIYNVYMVIACATDREWVGNISKVHLMLYNSQLSHVHCSDYNKLRYNYSFLKSEHENLKVRLSFIYHYFKWACYRVSIKL